MLTLTDKVVVICNSDVPWSKSVTEHWADLHGVDLTVIERPFGTAVLSASATGNAPLYVPETAEAFYQDLMKPVAEAVIQEGASWVFMGPATPVYVYYPRASFDEDGTRAYVSFPGLFGTCVGHYRFREELGLPPPTASYGGSGLPGGISSYLTWRLDIGSPSLFPFTTSVQREYSGYSQVGTQNVYGIMTQSQMGLGHPSYARNAAGFFGASEQDLLEVILPTTGFPLFAEFSSVLYAAPVIVGRIGKPVWHREGSAARAFNGDETEAEAIAVIEDAIDSEGTIEDHRHKPVWIGAHRRNLLMDDTRCYAVRDILERAGFTDIRWLTRSVPNAVDREIYLPNSGRSFTYSQLPDNPDNDCFLHLGYALTNQPPASTEPDGAGVTGVDIDNVFRYIKGSLAYSGTSFAMRHPMRCLRRIGQHGGAGGIGSTAEPGSTMPPANVLYALLKGRTLAETCQLSQPGGSRVFACGDPLYAPFRHETNPGNIEWWAPQGVAPGEVAFIEDNGGGAPEFEGQPFLAQGVGLAYRQRSVSARRTYRGTVQR